ncbi:hypothetical protein F2P79_005481 [Pimephales promelas]|nr:hypothetical protein F2P79_005481 [Pimephales promelas]
MSRKTKAAVSTSRWSRLVFDGDEKNYELWETEFLGHLCLQGLKETILNEPSEEDEEDETKNAEAYAELIQFLDDRSLSLVMREAADDGRAALEILRGYYAGKGKPRDDTRKVSEEPGDKEYVFRASDAEMWRHEKEKRGLMVDAGATSHIITDIAKFRRFDSSFQADTHCVELADGTRCNGVAKSRGDAAVCLVDNTGRRFKATLRNALYIPTYPQDIFSVKAATSNGATVIFREEKNVLLHKDDMA